METSDGRKPLSARAYYSRLTQALVTAMTAPMAEGRLYEVDMRLRPSGNQGPVATSLAAFRDYQAKEAWTWEHLALTRARPVAGSAEIGADVEEVRCEVLAAEKDRGRILGDIADMRARIEAAKGRGALWDPKVGRGRMQEVELMAQAGALLAGADVRDVQGGVAAATECGWLEAKDADTLTATYDALQALQIGTRLISEEPVDPDNLGQGAAAFLLRLMGEETMELLGASIADRTEATGSAIDRALEGTA